jgi:enterochelin esterase-like enzyme
MRRVWIPLLLLGLLAACAPNVVTTAPTLPPTETPSPTVTTQPGQTPTEVPAPTIPPTPTPLACWDDGGILVEDHVPSTLLPEPIVVLVYLPPCYRERPEAQYPTLYLIHGQNYTQDQWVRLGVTAAADDLIAAGEAAPFLIVLPYVSDWSQPADFPFGQAVVEEVQPFIETGYRANPQPAARAIGGISRGGSWAIHLGTRYWDLFSAFGGHSAPVFLDDDPVMHAWLDAIPPEQAPRIYLDIVTSELSNIRRSVIWFTGKLQERNLDHQFHEYHGSHTEDHWEAHLEEYLRFYTAEWRP